MSRVVTIHLNLDELEQKKATLEAEIAKLERDLDQVRRKIEAAPLFMQDAATTNGTASAAPKPQPTTHEVRLGEVVTHKESVSAATLPQAVLAVVRSKGPLTTVQIRDALLAGGFPREKLGATYSYLYTVLGRLIASKRLERAAEKYRLPRAATLSLVSEDATTAN